MKVRLLNQKKARIEILPLIDIVFLLLVFFIYAMLSMAVHRGLPVELPLSTTAEIDKKLILSVSVEADETVYVDKERVALSSLPDALRQRRVEQPDLKLFIGGDRAVRYEKVIEVLDVVRQAGISRVAFETKWKEIPEKI